MLAIQTACEKFSKYLSMAASALSPIALLLRNGTFQEARKVLEESPVGTLQEVCKQTGKNLVFVAAERPNDEEALYLVRELVDGKAKLNPGHSDHYRQTPLFFASRDGNAETLTYLCGKGLEIDQVDDAGQSALFYAAREGRSQVVELLSGYEVDLNRKDHIGQTALFYAAREARVETIETMLTLGCQPHHRDLQKKTCLNYAMAGKTPEHKLAAEIIRKAMTAKRPSANGMEVPPSKRQKVSRHRHQLVVQVLPTIGLDSEGLCVLKENSPEIVRGFTISPTPIQLAEFESRFPSLALWKQADSEPLTKEEMTEDALLPFRGNWGRVALRLVDELEKKDDAYIFAKPVDPLKWNCPDYYAVVKHPMDFETVKKKIKNHKYVRLRDFESDCEQVFSNCFTYNGPTSPVYSVGKKVQGNWHSLQAQYRLPDMHEVEGKLVELIQSMLEM
ncbi:MAG: hypothetical protein KVP17_001051 [Porospora cf. gigantea B]|uniref:uncharacterized protein n=1 Tax=Porospora cf. gigantea B TaxID=2853592 RepID=UPI003571A60B|nr:MAG: hypothetical protein KVP17_001051 [Porospora cf. gigantea B]